MYRKVPTVYTDAVSFVTASSWATLKPRNRIPESETGNRNPESGIRNPESGIRRGVKTAFLRDEGRRPDTSGKFTIVQIDGRSRSKCSLSNVAGKGSRQHDFCTTERAIFNSSGFEVGEKLLSSQLVVEISSEEKKSGISEGVGILLIRVEF